MNAWDCPCGARNSPRFAECRICGGPASDGAPAGAAPPQYSPSAAVSGPLDTTERAVGMAWTCLGMAACAFFLHHLLWEFFRDLPRPGAQPSVAESLLLLWVIVAGAVLSFCVMRFRRLYLSTPGRWSPDEVMLRRRRFAVLSSVGLALLLADPFVRTVYERA